MDQDNDAVARRTVLRGSAIGAAAAAFGGALVGPAHAAPGAVPAGGPKRVRPMLTGRVASRYVLSWSDEFEGAALDEDAWEYRLGTKNGVTNLAANVLVSDGHLRLVEKRESDGTYTAGGVYSKREFRYGYYEVRAKLTTAPGWHPAFWFRSAPDDRVRENLEIDFEVETQNPTEVSFGGLEHDYRNIIIKTFREPVDIGFDTSADFHVYGLDYSEAGLGFYLDGELIHSAPLPSEYFLHDASRWWLSVVGSGSGSLIDPATLPTEVLVDYVRYYQKDFYLTADVGYLDNTPGTGIASDGTVELDSSFAASSSLAGWNRTRVHTSPPRNPGVTATMTFETAGATGKYALHSYVPVFRNNDPAVVVKISQGGQELWRGTHDQTAGAYGWQQLAEVMLSPHGPVTVVMEHSDTGYFRVNALKFMAA